MENKFWSHKTVEVSDKAKIGEGTKIWHNCQVLDNAQIGKNCVIGHNCLVDGGAKIGNNVKIESNTDVWNLVELKDYVFIGPSVVFTNDPNPRAKYSKKDYPQYGKWEATIIEEGVSIGANATIVCGNKIGKWAFVGAGSVVTKDISDYALVVGVPGKIIGWVCKCGNKLNFDSNDKAICKICDRKYSEKEEKVNQLK
ncbi:MAG: N-acetyltransferase [Candidatus Pacebacteria bacterium]|nr:N-acetyltransferase [Candidatus Paceibacterota bacterium]